MFTKIDECIFLMLKRLNLSEQTFKELLKYASKIGKWKLDELFLIVDHKKSHYVNDYYSEFF